MNFEPLGGSDIILPPLLHAETLHARPPLISFDKATVRRSLDDQHRRIFDDHADYDCLQMIVREEEEQAYLVIKRRSRSTRINRWVPKAPALTYSEVLYCSAPAPLARHLERIKMAILRRQRTPFLVANEHLFLKCPRGLPIEARARYRSPALGAGDLDRLYSELALLPI